MSDVYTILDTLETEGLSGPLTDGSLEVNSPAQSNDKCIDYFNDPRWNELFHRFFVESEDANHDDMLFFVRNLDDYDEDNNNQDQTNNNDEKRNDGELDAVFVLRKQPPPNILPPLKEEVMWKETFLLNLIVQMPCKLTVAVCRRRSKQATATSSSGGMIASQRGGMSVVRKHVSKRVYALPNKSRMDRPKDCTNTLECSWPHIYYVIDDYEDMFEDMFIKKGEYLCVELSARIPVPSNSPLVTNSSKTQPNTATNSPKNSVNTASAVVTSALDNKAQNFEKPLSYNSQDGSVNGANGIFNSVRSRLTSSASTGGIGGSGTSKIVLFQGAASFGALLDNYVHRLSSRNVLHRLRKPTYPPEFIMMRGPGGKGHAQVAITGRTSSEDLNRGISSRSNSLISSPVLSANGNNNSVRTLSSQQQKQPSSPPLLPHALPGSAANSTPSSPSLSAWLKKISLPSIAENLSQATSPPPPPKSLQASMTFVSVPWQCIIDDLLEFKRKL